jgi:hypothetical protein
MVYQLEKLWSVTVFIRIWKLLLTTDTEVFTLCISSRQIKENWNKCIHYSIHCSFD